MAPTRIYSSPDLLDSLNSTNAPRLQIPARASVIHAAALPSACSRRAEATLAPPSDRQCQRIDRDRHPTGSATRVAQVVLSGKLVIETDAGTMPNRPARIRGRRYLEVVGPCGRDPVVPG
jgi:hypothetical protein